jgi:T1SS-143 domain-containing protein
VTFEFVGWQWQASLGGVPLTGADGASVLFSDASLNPGGSHLQDTGSAGNQNWEDQTLTSDYDYNDVSTNVTWGSALQVDESNFTVDATANFSGVFNVQPGADGQQSLTYQLSVQNADSGLVDSATNEAVILRFNAGVIEGRTSLASGNHLVFTLSVDGAGNVTLDQIRAIVHPTGDPDEAKFLGAGHVSLGATVTDGDGDKANASIDIGTVISFKDDGPSVQPNALVKLDDDALANGIPDGTNDDIDTLNISGTLAHSFGADGAGSVQWLTGGAPLGFTYTAGPDGSLLISQGSTLVLTATLNSTTGVYSITQNAPILHADADQENNQAFTLNYQVADKDGDTANGVLNINVDDDTPMAQNDVAYVSTGQVENINMVFVLDFSGSISNSELDQMLDAVRAAGQELFNSAAGAVQIQIVAFSGDSIGYPAVTDITAFTNLVNSLNPSEPGGVRPLDGNTDFTDAIQQTMASYVPQSGWNNQVVFISDGNPNEQRGSGGHSLTDTTAAAWNTFVDSNGITVTTVGVGNGIIDQRLEDVDMDAGPNNDPLRASDFGALVNTLLDNVVGGLVKGNVLHGSDGVVGGGDDDGYGADGPGRIMSIEINGTTYSWDGVLDGDQILNSIATSHDGELDFNFATGEWTYRAPNSGGGDQVETFKYVIVDKDGDTSQATLSVYVDDISPVIAKVVEDELSGGITDSDGETTIATGSISSLVAGPSTGVQFSLTGNTSGLADASSGGTPLVYSVVNDTLSAKAGGVTVFTLQVESDGDYTFTLLKPLDHSFGNGDDDELLVMDFASILLASNGSDAVPLAGQFLVQIEDDVPTVSTNAPVQLDDDALAGGLAGGPSGTDDADSVNIAGTLNHNFGADGAGTVKWLESGAPAGFTYQASPDGSQLLVKQGGTTVLTLTLNTATGVYSVTQNAPIQHANADLENNQAFTLSYQVTDKDGDKATGTLSINVDDDTPLAINDSASVAEASGKDFNVAFVLDSSGSISNGEFSTMMNAVMAAGQALFNGTSGDVKVTIVAFSSDSQAYAPVTTLAAFEALVDNIIDNRPFSGQTDFTDAIEQTMVSYSPISGWDNQVFFISDGNPNQQTGTGGNSLENDVADDWQSFLTSNGISVTTIGVGDGIDDERLEDVDLDADPDKTPVLVNDFDDLIDTLLGQIAGSDVSGNVLRGDDGVVGGGDDDSFGADGAGRIASIQINGVTYEWNGAGVIDPSSGPNIAGNQLSNITTALGGKLSFNFVTGDWNYVAPASVNADVSESFNYVIVDKDGDPSGANLTVTVLDVNQAPSGSNATLSVLEDGSKAFTGADFGFSDSDGDSLMSVKITAFSGGGTLSYNGGAVPAEIAVANLGLLVFTPAENANGNGYANITFQVRDNGGVGGGGTDLDPTSNQLTINVTPVNDAPAATISNLSYSATEGSNLILSGTGMSVSDIDGGAGLRTVTLAVSQGTLTVSAGNSGIANLSGSGTSQVTFRGTLTQLNNLLGGIDAGFGSAGSISYSAVNAPVLAASLLLLIDDEGQVGGSALSALDTATINIAATADPTSANNDSVRSNVGGDVAFNIPEWSLLWNDNDADGPLDVSTVNSGSGGSASHSAGTGSYGSVSFTDTGSSGGSFNYTANNGSSGDTASVSVVRDTSGDLDGSSRADILVDGLSGAHTLNGGNGNDILIGNDGNDILNGGNNNDLLVGGSGDDTLNGDSGNDTAGYFDAVSGVTVDLSVSAVQNTGGAGWDTLNSIENLVGSSFGDTLIGNSDNNLLLGLEGDDILIGNGGNDTLTGGDGADTFKWLLGNTGTTTVTDFVQGVDSLDLSQLLVGEDDTAGSLSQYLTFAFSTNTTITVDANAGAGGGTGQTIVLEGINLQAAYGAMDAAGVITAMLGDDSLKVTA